MCKSIILVQVTKNSATAPHNRGKNHLSHRFSFILVQNCNHRAAIEIFLATMCDCWDNIATFVNH